MRHCRMSPPYHPNQTGRCRSKRTVLFVGEGPMERAFLRHVIDCFIQRDGQVAAKAENAHGGDPSVVIATAKKLLRQRSYDRCLVLMDTDRSWPANLPTHIGKTSVVFVPEEPVIEGLLLRILGHPNITTSTTVAECKRVLYRNYIDEKRRTNPLGYKRYFSRGLLESSRSSCPPLNMILQALE